MVVMVAILDPGPLFLLDAMTITLLLHSRIFCGRRGQPELTERLMD